MSESNPYLDAYRAQAAHEEASGNRRYLISDKGQADGYCGQRYGKCTVCRHRRELSYAYSWAIPNEAALRAIALHGPVVEIGAGGGYWAKLLRDRGVDVIAYDPDPAGGGTGLDGQPRGWHDGTRWSEVLLGDHTAVIGHPDRTLLLVWPSYDLPWTDQVLDLYSGDTVIYVGEGSGGCTGTSRMHALLGDEPYCWHSDAEEPCTCGDDSPLFKQIDEVAIPQWGGIHDRLFVHKRIGGVS